MAAWLSACLSVLETLSQPCATVGVQSLHFTPPDNMVQLLDLSGNRLDGSAGEPLANMLLVNKVGRQGP